MGLNCATFEIFMIQYSFPSAIRKHSVLVGSDSETEAVMSNINTTNTTILNNAAEVEAVPSIAVGKNDVVSFSSQTTTAVADPQSLLTCARNVSLADAIIDDEVVFPRTVVEYTSLFRKAEELSAREILAMCRIVYEANKTLNSADFADFCQRIGYKDTSSAIRKQIVIGKLQPRLIRHAEALPATWTGIYSITQIPAQEFELLMNKNRSFKDMPNSKIQALVKQTRNLDQVNLSPAMLTLDEQKRNILNGTIVAKVYFSKVPDDLDWKAFEKAMREVEANLPLKIQFTGDLQDLFSERKLKRYEKIKKKQDPQVFKPATWDMGVDVTNMRQTVLDGAAQNESEKSAA
jgi:hypothetical protein